MPRFRYEKGYLYCRLCATQYKKEDCPYYQSKGMQYFQVCPSCPQKWKLRKSPHHKKSETYYVSVLKPLYQSQKGITSKSWKNKNKKKVEKDPVI